MLFFKQYTAKTSINEGVLVLYVISDTFRFCCWSSVNTTESRQETFFFFEILKIVYGFVVRKEEFGPGMLRPRYAKYSSGKVGQ